VPTTENLFKMNIIFFFQLVLLMNCFYFFDKNHISSNIPSGYYHGSGVFVVVNNDTAIADFIFFQKYPRELMTDTLLYNESNHNWLGESSTLYEKKGKYYIRINDKSSLFYRKKDIRIKQDENYYKNHIDEYKNLAVLHKCYVDYLDVSKDKVDASKRFYELQKNYNLNQLLNHSDFLKELKKFKSDLK